MTRRVPPGLPADVQPKGFTSRDLDRREDEPRSDEAADVPFASVIDHD